MNIIYAISLAVALVITLCSAYTDVKTGLIPDRITYTGLFIGVILNGIYYFAGYKQKVILTLISFVIYVVIFLIIGLFDGIGGGDIKLFSALSLLLGLSGITFIFFTSNVIGAVSGLIKIIMKKATVTSRMVFGPCIAMATLLYIVLTYIMGWNIITI